MVLLGQRQDGLSCAPIPYCSEEGPQTLQTCHRGLGTFLDDRGALPDPTPLRLTVLCSWALLSCTAQLRLYGPIDKPRFLVELSFFLG